MTHEQKYKPFTIDCWEYGFAVWLYWYYRFPTKEERLAAEIEAVDIYGTGDVAPVQPTRCRFEVVDTPEADQPTRKFEIADEEPAPAVVEAAPRRRFVVEDA